MNKKGVTLIEMIVSISLISIVMVMLLNLFLSIRNVYNTSKIQADYELITAAIIKSVGDDIADYGLISAEYTSDENEILLTFDAYRPTNLSERIKKVLKITKQDENYFISYIYDPKQTQYITKNERMSNISRVLPKDIILDEYQAIKINHLNDTALEIKIPITNSKATEYSINIYGLIKN